jgi:threonine dehydrogenase-like Zn-dependent dehydrogenase
LDPGPLGDKTVDVKAVRARRGSVVVEEIEEPPGTGELLYVKSASICGSDFGYLAGGSGFILGHELAGVTDDGRAVAVEPLRSCMSCAACLEGRYNLCSIAHQQTLGLTVDGGLCEVFRHPAHHLETLPTGLDVGDASLVEPASVAWHGLRISGTAADSRVAVVGGGAIGLLAVAGARAMGAEEVALDARYPHQREAGERLGGGEPSGLYDVVIESAGSSSSLARSVELVAPGGSIAILGLHLEGFSPDFLTIFTKEARVLPSIAYCSHDGTKDFSEAASMLAANPDISEALITHRFPLSDAEEAFRVAQDRGAGAIKVVIEP